MKNMEISPDIYFVTYDALLNFDCFNRFSTFGEPIVISKNTAIQLGDFAQFFNIADIYEPPEETIDIIRDPEMLEAFTGVCYDMYVRPDEVILVGTQKEIEYAQEYFGDGMLEVI